MRVEYIMSFNHDSWQALTSSEKEQHTLSKCTHCLQRYPVLTEGFPGSMMATKFKLLTETGHAGTPSSTQTCIILHSNQHCTYITHQCRHINCTHTYQPTLHKLQTRQPRLYRYKSKTAQTQTYASQAQANIAHTSAANTHIPTTTVRTQATIIHT